MAPAAGARAVSGRSRISCPPGSSLVRRSARTRAAEAPTPAVGAEAPEGAVQEVEVKQEVIEAAAAELEEQGLSRWFTDEDGVEREMTDAEWCWANRGNKKLTAGSLIELIGMGMGAPMPASIEYDSERKVVRMEFEANNSECGGYAYMDEGYVDEDADVMRKIGSFFGFGRKKAAEGE